MTVYWSSDWRCPKCGHTEPIEPAQDTRPIETGHVCDPLALKRAERDDSVFTLDLTDAEPVEEHECVFVEEQEPSGRLVLPPCIVCGFTAMDALAQLHAASEPEGGESHG